MTIKHSRNVLHLSITERTVSIIMCVCVCVLYSRTCLFMKRHQKKALRVVLYIAKDKIEWYNDHGLHEIVFQELYPVILNNIVQDQGLSVAKRQKTGEANQIIHCT